MIDTNKFKALLKTELAELLNDLGKLGFVEEGDDWKAKQDDLNVLEADSNEVADKIEDYESDTAVLKELEERYNEVKEALARIEAGTYGIDEVSGEPIAENRLMANPAARTSVENASKLGQPPLSKNKFE